MLRFSYGEVLDATKHQDDKVGRLLAAVAFLTGGALVFASNDVLDVDFAVGDYSYPLAAVALALFIVLDLVAVATYLVAIAAPLTLPRRPPGHASHLYFRIISEMGEDEWRSQWSRSRLNTFEDEIVEEIVNIARRADRKYGRTTIATNLFLAALVVLAPTVVLGLSAAAHDVVRGTVAWEQPLRWGTGLSIAVVVITLFVPQAPTRRGEKYGRIWPLRALSFVYPAMLCMLVVANPQRSFPASGALAVLILAVLSVVLTAWTYSDTGKHTLPYPFVVAAIAALGLIAWGRDRPDLQLFIALAGGVLVVVPSIVEELLHRSASARAAPP
jgi:hypothetical protein